MFNENGSVAIVFNGEIYNHAPLKQELERLGHVFASRCDTEVILHAWESWGPDCLQRFNGMFAIAVWDRNQRCLFLARDRLGKKPIYYATMPDGRFVFASEMNALLEAGLPRRIDAVAVEEFFTFGYIPDPRTIYHRIHRLEAAHYLLVRPDEPQAAPQRYWRLAGGTTRLAETEAIGELTARLRESVALRLIADVPLGAFLSGGVDSSAVVALAAGLREAPVSTFTVGFAGTEDERPFARAVARRYLTLQHEETAAEVDYIAAAREQARIFGEPFGDSSSVPTYTVSRMARRHVTVALSGDGGDEVLAGYRRYRFHLLVEHARRLLPAGVRRRLIGELARLYPKLDRAPRWLRAKHTLTELSLDSALGYYRTLCKTDTAHRRALFAPALRCEIEARDPAQRMVELMAESGTDDPLRQAQFVDIGSYLPGDILTKVDRASMATSLEVRGPLLDYRFVEWGVALPPSLKLRHGRGKYLLKRAMEPLLPANLLHRRKQGFATSLAQQFRRATPRLRERLLGPALLESGIFDANAIARLLDEHAAGRCDRSGTIWPLLVFEGFLAHSATITTPGGARAIRAAEAA
jgi:asparagine synthase (glutamine-hydrolysing)